MKLKTLVNFLNETLDIKAVHNDVSNNGLQIQGCKDIEKALFTVDFSLELVDYAIDHDVQFIFVHHGQSWGNSMKYITGSNYNRIKPMIDHGISLYAVHLPLDRHPEYGHNAVMSKMINLHNVQPFCEYEGINIGFKGILSGGMSFDELSKKLRFELNEYILKNSKPYLYKLDNFVSLSINNSKGQKLSKIGIVSGGGSKDSVYSAISDGLDCLITGEFTHSSFFTAKESGLSVIAAGHYLTETPGVIRMMQLVEKHSPGIEVEFIDIPTGL
ncbi:MAG: Nif3-like dinuclear metal center hexameric protein [Lentisphaerae bacterium GWF2_38_69]|nr:MAG: Nif3-like dinuclear metal center hexameric protein [Lentisphaerae bacterium GWF2_38_69]